VNKRLGLLLLIPFLFFGASYPERNATNTTIFEPNNFNITNAQAEFNSLPPALFFGIKTVVIDAGHGGKDPGCLGITTSKEKDIALGIALKLGKYIQEKTPDVKVIYTRTTDVFLELNERAAIANKNKADLFICIHCNTACHFEKNTKKKICNEAVFGTETYVMGLHKSNANLNVAKRENEAILLEKDYKNRYDGFDPDSETGYILLTMQQSAYLKQSMNFASKVQKHVTEKAGRKDKGVQQAGFLVLWRTAMPSVLIETEFLSNTESEIFAGSEEGQGKIAWGIFTAFRQYKDEVEGKYAKYDDENEDQKIDVKEPEQPIKKEDKKDKDKGKIKTEIEDKVIEKPKTKEPIVEEEINNATASNENTQEKKEEITVTPTPKDTEIIEPVKIIEPEKKPEVIPNAEAIVYKVQFISSGKRIPLLSDDFKKLKDVGEYEDTGLYKYTAGEFNSINEAMEYRKVMQGIGFKDCFVVKFKDGKRMKN